jgi:hypothetical protein
MKLIENIKYIAEQAYTRRNSSTWNNDQNIELFDSIDSLTPEEYNWLLSLLEKGGYKIKNNLSSNEIIDEIWKEHKLDLFIKKGIELNKEI